MWQDTFSLNLRNKLKTSAIFFIFVVWIDVVTTKKLKNYMAAVPHIVCVCHKAQGTHIRDILEK